MRDRLRSPKPLRHLVSLREAPSNKYVPNRQVGRGRRSFCTAHCSKTHHPLVLVPGESIGEQLKTSVSPKYNSPVCKRSPERDDVFYNPSAVGETIYCSVQNFSTIVITGEIHGRNSARPVTKSRSGADRSGICDVVTGDVCLEPSNILQE